MGDIRNMASFKDYAMYFILAGLMMILIFKGGVELAKINGISSTEIIDTEQANITGLTSSLDSVSNSAEGWRKSFQSDNPLVVSAGLVVQSIWSLSVLIFNSVLGVFIIITTFAEISLGIPSIVTGVVLALVIMGMIFSTYFFIRSGS